jgi:putative nucleotidyltransferase with HDIG domain
MDDKQLKRDSARSAASVPERIAEAMTFLPPSFELIPRLLLLLDDPEANAEAIADLIRIDAGLTADILHVANSAHYARGNRVETLIEAVNRVGLREIYRTVMNVLASPVLANVHQVGFARLDLWTHSLTTALAAQVLSTRLRTIDPEVAFTAALLHDVGKVVLAQAMGSAYIALLEEGKLNSTPTFSLERLAYQTDHGDVGAKLLKQWNFPEKIVSAIEFHHTPEKAGRGSNGHLPSTVYAANVLAYRVATGTGFPPYAANPDISALRGTGLRPQELFEYEGEVRDALEQERRRSQF